MYKTRRGGCQAGIRKGCLLAWCISWSGEGPWRGLSEATILWGEVIWGQERWQGQRSRISYKSWGSQINQTRSQLVCIKIFFASSRKYWRSHPLPVPLGKVIKSSIWWVGKKAQPRKRGGVDHWKTIENGTKSEKIRQNSSKTGKSSDFAFLHSFTFSLNSNLSARVRN